METNMRNWTIKGKLLVACLGFGLLPLLLYGGVSFYLSGTTLKETDQQAREHLELEVEAKLEAIRANKQKALQDYFEESFQTLHLFSEMSSVKKLLPRLRAGYEGYPEGKAQELRGFYEAAFGAKFQKETGRSAPVDRLLTISPRAAGLQHAYISSNPHPLGQKQRLMKAGEQPYDEVHQELHALFSETAGHLGYYDIFVVDWESGEVIYSVYKELDFATSLKSGPYAQSGLGETWRALKTGKKLFFSDYKLYTPSYEAPAAFVGAPIRGESKQAIAALIIQLPLDQVNGVMGERSGLGETGESYLVGADHLMRSDSYLDPQDHSVLSSFRKPETGRVDTEAVKEGLAGRSGLRVVQDYNGNPVYSAWTPLKIAERDWVLLVEIDEAEAMASVKTLEKNAEKQQSQLLFISLALILSTAFLIGLLSLGIARALVRPIEGTTVLLQDIAEGEGDLTQRLEILNQDELGELAEAFNTFAEKIQELIQEVAETGGVVSGAAQEISAGSTELTERAEISAEEASIIATAGEEIAHTTQALSGAAEELNASITEIASNASRASELAEQANTAMKNAVEIVSTMDQQASEISAVVEVIDKVAAQTNLLALNATIEAARAGEAGQGFAVVASEVKQLANETSTATLRIADRLEQVKLQSRRSVVAIEELTTFFDEIKELQVAVGASVEEQSATTMQIASSVSQTAQTSQEIATNIFSLAEGAKSTSQMAEQSNLASASLNVVSHQLNQMIGRFKY